VNSTETISQRVDDFEEREDILLASLLMIRFDSLNLGRCEREGGNMRRRREGGGRRGEEVGEVLHEGLADELLKRVGEEGEDELLLLRLKEKEAMRLQEQRR